MATIVGSGQQDDLISFLDIHMKENGKQSFNYYIGLTRDPGTFSLFRKWSIWTTSFSLVMTQIGDPYFLKFKSRQFYLSKLNTKSKNIFVESLILIGFRTHFLPW